MRSGRLGPLALSLLPALALLLPLLAALVLLLLVLMAVFAQQLAPHDPLRPARAPRFTEPGAQFPFGTDELGRDVLSRVIFGSRISLTVGAISVGIAAGIGVLIGLIAGYFGGLAETALMRLVDLMLAFPGILLAIAIVAVLGPGLNNVMIAVGIAGIPTYARVTRGTTLQAKQNLYVEAARTLGAGNARIIVRHILPNVVAPVIVLMTLGVAGAMLAAAGLSFMGLGAQPPTPEWGAMLSTGRTYIRDAWWLSTFPGLAIMVTVLAINLLGDGLRDALDPRLRT